MPNQNLPTVRGNAFDLSITNTEQPTQLSDALKSNLDDTDYDGFEAPRESLSIVSIRQRPLVDGRKTVEEAGGFKMYDSLAKAAEAHIADVSGEIGILITILSDQASRTYWRSLSDPRPACKSIDGLNGIGEPGGTCATCKMAGWNPTAQKAEDQRPKCSAEINLLVWDHSLGSAYVLRLGRSGIKPYNNFKTWLKRQAKGSAYPLHCYQVCITTSPVQDPVQHFVPMFQIKGEVSLELFQQLKKLRSDMRPQMETTAGINTVDDEHPAADPGVEQVRTNKDDDDLPF